MVLQQPLFLQKGYFNFSLGLDFSNLFRELLDKLIFLGELLLELLIFAVQSTEALLQGQNLAIQIIFYLLNLFTLITDSWQRQLTLLKAKIILVTFLQSTSLHLRYFFDVVPDVSDHVTKLLCMLYCSGIGPIASLPHIFENLIRGDAGGCKFLLVDPGFLVVKANERKLSIQRILFLEQPIKLSHKQLLSKFFMKGLMLMNFIQVVFKSGV